MLNSFGHPVPRVAGKLQRTGRSAAGKVLETEFTDAADTVAFDISSAYDVKGLKKLTRTFVFSRQGRGSLSVVDRVEFDRPEDFSTALITFCKWSRDGQSGLVVGDGKDKVRVEIDTGAEPFELKPVTIDEDVRADRQPVRLGIELKKPVESATVSLKIVPAN